MNLFTSLGVNMEFNQNTGLNKEEFNYFKNEIYLRKKYSNLFPMQRLYLIVRLIYRQKILKKF